MILDRPGFVVKSMQNRSAVQLYKPFKGDAMTSMASGKPEFVTPDKAVKIIKSGDHIHLSSVASSPQCLIHALCARGRTGELRNVYLHHLHTEGPAPYTDAEFEGVFHLDSFFVGANVRTQTQKGFADYIPVFLSETQRLYRDGYLPCHVAMVQVCPPDEHGFVSLGTSVDATLAAIETAAKVIAVINPNVPRTFGDAVIAENRFDYFVQDDTPLETVHFTKPDPVEEAIGKHCASLIEDGATLQMGIGAIPNAVLDQLGGHKNLGIHTEMFADGVIPLVEKGVINGAKKAIDGGKMVATFLLGSKKLYDFVHLNPDVLMMDVGYTNDPFVIAKNPKVTAINSALQIDLTGQISADSLGAKFYSGVGGQVDFFYGASRSKGGKAMIAMPSVTSDQTSKIASVLLPGAGVVTTRAHVHWLVTEYGAVNLYGRSLQERARLIISIAHPEHQEELDRAAFERFGSHYHFIGK
jgi:acyl-CoA hydrolase